jgi:hypothetical protein
MNAIAAVTRRVKTAQPVEAEGWQSGPSGHRPTPVFQPLPKPKTYYEFNHLRELVEVSHG